LGNRFQGDPAVVDAKARVTDELLKKYETVSNATVLGELSRHGYMKVFMEGVHSLAPGRRLVGRAVTLRYLPSRPDLQEHVTHGGHGEGFNETPRWDALESLTPGDVLVADCMGLSMTSTGGDVVFSRIITKKAAGLVTDGGVRDGHKVAEYGYPVYGGGSTPTVGEPNVLPYEVNEMIQCGGVLVWPGDVILGDEDGIVVLPGHMAEEIYDECVRHDQIEQAILEHTQAEEISPKTFYPFNEETERIYAEWKVRHGVA
jgi:regulator of RNase E activity RraA